MKPHLLIFAALLLAGCQKEDTVFSDHASDIFYIENANSSMRVLVEGNSASKIFILLVHGGPGIGSLIYNTDFISENLENKYVIVYWDQRNSGESQGTINGKNLTFDQTLDDLKKVTLVLKKRYGRDIEIFLMAHSFGGLVAAGFLTADDDQNLFKGYIDIDGSHNYPLNDTLTRNKLISTGMSEVAQNSHTEEWQEIIDYCNSHTGNFSLEQSLQLEKYASRAENYIEDVTKVNYFCQIAGNALSDNYSISSMLVNLITTNNSDLNKEIATKEFSSSLFKITIPVLVLWGKYDFVCPPELGNDFLSRISSTVKKMAISPVSGHNLMFQDKTFFTSEVSAFIEQNR
jgi:pimeloyl-ACP methyl ester carboxylesterase